MLPWRQSAPVDGTPMGAAIDGRPGLAIGWLSSTTPYPRGEVPEVAARTLVRLCEDRSTVVAQTRGWHQCPFCTAVDARSSSELWIQGRVGDTDVIFKMPRLVGHYVTDHGYQPPAEVLLELTEGPRVVTDRD